MHLTYRFDLHFPVIKLLLHLFHSKIIILSFKENMAFNNIIVFTALVLVANLFVFQLAEARASNFGPRLSQALGQLSRIKRGKVHFL